MISKFIRQWRAFRLSLRLLKLIDPKKLEDINVILEEIYPGIRAEIRALVESYDIHATSKTLHYINTHGGVETPLSILNFGELKLEGLDYLKAYKEPNEKWINT